MSSTLVKHNVLLLGDTAPDFSADSTQGTINFHQWLDNSWCIFFSHPKDFTPVCTTELGQTARLKPEFDKRGIKVLALSVDSVENHKNWIKDINETQNVTVNFPLIGDENRHVAELYGMIHPKVSETSTVRSVFIIDPKKKIRMTMTYPAASGRDFNEILRLVDSVQLTDKHSVATPAGWQWGQDCIILPSITDPAVLKEKFPQGWKEVKPYLRITPQPK
jgi:alkyl hydroperoxide reductase subunit AhpC